MHLIFRGVNDAFRGLVELFHRCDQEGRHGLSKPWVVRNSSRNGDVLMIEEPVLITYSHPRERVLFNTSRDANPLFHLYESLWMLAGRNDVAPLAYYAQNMKNYSDDGKTLNGAYGYRWRRACADYEGTGYYDQLQILINHLRADPTSRRAVLQMWNVEDDLLKIGSRCDCIDGSVLEPIFPEDPSSRHTTVDCPKCKGSPITPGSKDVCCNLSVMFSIRGVWHDEVEGEPFIRYLDMTVTNRSNDMIWGMLGANYVHFSFLQEYMAAHLGCEVGVYNQFTNNLHVYMDNWKPDEWLADEQPNYYVDSKLNHLNVKMQAELWGKEFTTLSLIKDPAVFDKELSVIVDWYGGDNGKKLSPLLMYNEPFFENVASHALNAFRLHKHRLYKDAMAECSLIKADDWRIACTSWIEKRKRMWENRKGAEYTQGVN